MNRNTVALLFGIFYTIVFSESRERDFTISIVKKTVSFLLAAFAFRCIRSHVHNNIRVHVQITIDTKTHRWRIAATTTTKS